jgi:hypothetical protein
VEGVSRSRARAVDKTIVSAGHWLDELFFIRQFWGVISFGFEC